MNDSLRLVVQKITKLPTLPAIAQTILSLASDESTDMKELEETIQKDPSISAKILSFSNSAFYGMSSNVTTIRDAVVRMGFNNVKNIALGISLMTIMNNGKTPHALDYKKIFKHSFTVGVISNHFLNELDIEISEDLFTGGLLHDIGLIIINNFFSDIYRKVIYELKNDMPLIDVEKNVLGFTHADIGTWLADKWNLPDIIKDIIMYHHTPSLAKKHKKSVSIIHLADFVSTMRFCSVTDGEPHYTFNYSTLEVIGLKEKEFKNIEAKLNEIIFPDEIFE